MTKAWDEWIHFIISGCTPASVLDFQPSAEIKERVMELIRKEKDGGLLPEEARELDGYLQLEDLMRRVKAKARSWPGRE